MGKEGECVTCGKEFANLPGHYNRYYPSHKPEHWPECPSCGERYNHIGQHWRQSECEYPQLTQYQYEVLVGLMMGDGSIDVNSKNLYLSCSMITKEYLECVDEIFGILGTGVRLYRTAEEAAKHCRDTGFSPNAEEENYSDVYHWKTRTLPQLEEFTEWYENGEKLWPENIDLTSTVLKHWYVGDGSYHNKNGHNHIKITLSNEINNEEKVANYFKEVGLPQPNNWSVNEFSNGYELCDAIWGVDESKQLFKYMLKDGHGIPDGFEYKFPEELH